jgi:hypothetical protein
MIYLLSVVILTLGFWYGIVRPTYNEICEEQRQQSRRDLYLTQLKWVRQAYPELQDLSYTEISENFHIEDAYNRIHYS